MAGKNKCLTVTFSRILWVAISVLLWTGSVSTALEVTAPQDFLFIDVYTMPAGDFSVDLSSEIYYGIYVDSGYTINVLDGAIVHYMEVYKDGTANIKGGFFDFLGVAGFADSTIAIYGTYVNHFPVFGAYFDAATDSLVVDNPSVGWGGTITCIYEGASSESYIPISFYDDIQFAVSNGPQQIDIDIKPGGYPNSINLESKGVVPVAILGDGDFDVTYVAPDSVEFAGASPVRWALEDVDDDGDTDLIFHFKTKDLNLTDSSTEATLTGQTNDAVEIQGSDTVKIVPSKKK